MAANQYAPKAEAFVSLNAITHALCGQGQRAIGADVIARRGMALRALSVMARFHSGVVSMACHRRGASTCACPMSTACEAAADDPTFSAYSGLYFGVVVRVAVGKEMACPGSGC